MDSHTVVKLAWTNLSRTTYPIDSKRLLIDNSLETCSTLRQLSKNSPQVKLVVKLLRHLYLLKLNCCKIKKTTEKLLRLMSEYPALCEIIVCL